MHESERSATVGPLPQVVYTTSSCTSHFAVIRFGIRRACALASPYGICACVGNQSRDHVFYIYGYLQVCLGSDSRTSTMATVPLTILQSVSVPRSACPYIVYCTLCEDGTRVRHIPDGGRADGRTDGRTGGRTMGWAVHRTFQDICIRTAAQ